MIEALDWIERSSARAHALKDIRTFFNWCVPRYLATSPAVGIKMDKQPSRDRVLTDDELKAVWVAADDCGQFGVIVKLLMLTGQRRTEISSLQWDWVKSDRITLPATLTKNKVPMRVTTGLVPSAPDAAAAVPAAVAVPTITLPYRPPGCASCGTETVTGTCARWPCGTFTLETAGWM